MEIIEKYLTINPYSRCGQRMEAQPRGLVYHYGGTAGQDAMGMWRYFEGLKNQIPDKNGKVPRKASAPLIIDLDGVVLQTMPLEEIAFHCGPLADTVPEALRRYGPWPNACLIGIEMCHIDWAGRFTEATLRAAQELGAHLCELYDINPDEDVLRHYDVTRKLCPRWFVDHPADWVEFKKSIRQRTIQIACVGAKDGDC